MPSSSAASLTVWTSRSSAFVPRARSRSGTAPGLGRRTRFEASPRPRSRLGSHGHDSPPHLLRRISSPTYVGTASKPRWDNTLVRALKNRSERAGNDNSFEHPAVGRTPAIAPWPWTPTTQRTATNSNGLERTIDHDKSSMERRTKERSGESRGVIPIRDEPEGGSGTGWNEEAERRPKQQFGCRK